MLIKTDESKKRRTPSPFGMGNLNPTNVQAVEWLKGAHPSFAEHIWQRNGLVQAIAMERFGGVDVLNLPVCERCEKPGAWHDNDSCWCFPCGHRTPKERTKTLYRYIAEDSMPGGMAQEEMELLTKMLIPTLSGALAEMFESIDNIENTPYEAIEGEEELEVQETLVDNEESEDVENEEAETTTDHSAV